MKTLLATVGAALTAVTLGAAEAESEKVETETEETPLFEAGVDIDYYSAFIWRNAVVNDRQVIQPCVWGELNILSPFSIGFSIWQNWDITDRARGRDGVFKHALDETDYNVHVGIDAWSDDDETMSLALEIGHEWFTYQSRRRDACDENCDTRELYFKATFENPIIDIYGQISWMYDDFGRVGMETQKGIYYEIGLKKEVELTDTFSVGADWSLGFGDRRYLAYLYGDRCVYEDDDVSYLSHPKAGLGGTTIKGYVIWALTDWMSLKGTIAYTGVINGDARDALRYDECPSDYRDIVWGGISLNFEF